MILIKRVSLPFLRLREIRENTDLYIRTGAGDKVLTQDTANPRTSRCYWCKESVPPDILLPP